MNRFFRTSVGQLVLACSLACTGGAWGADVPALSRITKPVPPPPEKQMPAEFSSLSIQPYPEPSAPAPVPTQDSAGGRPPATDTAIRPLGSLTVNIAPSGKGQMPADPAHEYFADAGTLYSVPGLDRPWPQITFFWQSSSFYHRPLYFEETNLERNGFNVGLAQPVLSAAHFFATIPALPYLAAVNRPNEPVYTLGQYRPGSNVPYRCNWTPLQLDAAVVEGSFMTGLVFLIP